MKFMDERSSSWLTWKHDDRLFNVLVGIAGGIHEVLRLSITKP